MHAGVSGAYVHVGEHILVCAARLRVHACELRVCLQAQGRKCGSHRHGNADKHKYASKHHSLLALILLERHSINTHPGQGVPAGARGARVRFSPLLLSSSTTCVGFGTSWADVPAAPRGGCITEPHLIPLCDLEKAKCNQAANFSAQKAGGKAVPEPRQCLSPGRIPAASHVSARSRWKS